MYAIYVLKLEDNKYYVGKTQNLNKRIDQHFKGKGSVWTKRYKPTHIFEIYWNVDKYDEDKYTEMYMEKYGIENVRGGSYSKIILEESCVNVLNKKFDTYNDRCYSCGKTGHFIKDCPNVKKKNSSSESESESDNDNENENNI